MKFYDINLTRKDERFSPSDEMDLQIFPVLPLQKNASVSPIFFVVDCLAIFYVWLYNYTFITHLHSWLRTIDVYNITLLKFVVTSFPINNIISSEPAILSSIYYTLSLIIFSNWIYTHTFVRNTAEKQMFYRTFLKE